MEEAFPPNTSALTSLIKSTHLLRLEEMVRGARSLQELQFLAVNETRRLIPFRQAFWVGAERNDRSDSRIEAASSISILDRETPLIQWLEKTVRGAPISDSQTTPLPLTKDDIPESLRSQWKDFAFPYVLWCPLMHPDGSFHGGLWLMRDTPWEESELTLLQRLSGAFAHAKQALGRRKGLRPKTKWTRMLVGTFAVLGLAILLVPVRLSTLAPAKILAKEPAVVSAPMDGVIADILVPPNSLVTKDQVIFTYEDTALRNQFKLAEKNLAVAVAEYRQATQRAFLDPQVKAEVPLLKAEAQLRETELIYARELLNQVEVRAPHAGLILYSDKADWLGRPIKVGERIMDIADPERIEVGINLAVDDAIVLKEGADVKLFLDASPLAALSGRISHASYQAETLPGQLLAYRVKAELKPGNTSVRIGWQGTAKIYGDKVPLFLLLFRRPISFIRQTVGL